MEMPELHYEEPSTSTSGGVQQPDHVFKILLIGDPGVGKSSILQRFTANRFDDNMSTTIGVDFAVKMISLGGKLIKLMIWDKAGKQKFRNQTFYRGAKGVILVYDVTRASTLQKLEDHWLKELESNCLEDEMVRMVMANKLDLVDQGEATREVKSGQGVEFAQKHGCLFVETSAKTNIAVTAAFEEVVTKILETLP